MTEKVRASETAENSAAIQKGSKAWFDDPMNDERRFGRDLCGKAKGRRQQRGKE
jgi:hypothetical protein